MSALAFTSPTLFSGSGGGEVTFRSVAGFRRGTFETMANDRPRALPSLKATLSYDQLSPPARGSLKATLPYDGAALVNTVAAPSGGVRTPLAVAATVVAEAGSAISASASPLTTTAARTTVLPRVTE